MASDRHKDHLNQYLKTHKSTNKTPERGKQSQNRHAQASTSRGMSSPKTDSARLANTQPRKKPPVKIFPVIPRGKANIGHLPNEILLEIFSYLGPSDLLSLSRVCHRWLMLYFLVLL